MSFNDEGLGPPLPTSTTDRPAPERPRPSPRLLKVRKLIERCYADPLSAGRMARHAGFTATELRRQFAACYDCTPEAYLIACRMRAAEALLALGRTEHNVALLVGYTSYRRYLGDRQRHQRSQRIAAGEAALREFLQR
ncbi:MAG: AraC family transcriptional regulator [Stagnimonas sp.]|nr:AraC family transcriptional regulator [Stagnimonas sp.]